MGTWVTEVDHEAMEESGLVWLVIYSGTNKVKHPEEMV